MAFLPWLNNNIASPILRGGQWLGQKIIQPGLSWLKANDKQLSPVIQAAEPLLETVGKAWNAGADTVEQNKRMSRGEMPDPKRQRVEAPSFGDVFRAGQSAVKTRQALQEAGGARNLANASRDNLKSRVMLA